MERRFYMDAFFEEADETMISMNQSALLSTRY
jgi:hypothetical protein